MRRWNSWGDDSFEYKLKKNVPAYLENLLGTLSSLPEATLASVCAKIPETRFSKPHPLIITDAETRVRYARGQSIPDWIAFKSGDFGTVPDGVAFPSNHDEVQDIIDWAVKKNVVIIPYGGGTSVTGHVTPQQSTNPILTISTSKLNQLLDLDKINHIALFGAGANGPQVESQLRIHGYCLGHYPQSFEHSTLGGWIAARSSGQQSLYYGRIEKLFAGGKIATPKGTLDIIDFPASSAGPDLREWVMGTEGRIGILTDVKVKITPLSEKEVFYPIFFPNWKLGYNFVVKTVREKLDLSMLRISDASEVNTHITMGVEEKEAKLLRKFLSFFYGMQPQDTVMVMIGVNGSKKRVQNTIKEVKKIYKQYKGFGSFKFIGKKWEHNRYKSAYLRESLWQIGCVADTLETSTNWSNVNNLKNKLETAMVEAYQRKYKNEKVHIFTHLSHVYQQGSSIYTSYFFRMGNSYKETMERWKVLKEAASKTISENGGTISHQHGVGRDHAPYLPAEKGELGMEAINSFLTYFDKKKNMNPGVLIQDEK